MKDWPKTENRALRQRVYRKIKSGQYQVQEVHDPMTGQNKGRIVHTGNHSEEVRAGLNRGKAFCSKKR